MHEEINSHMSPKFPNLKFKCHDQQVVNSTIHGYSQLYTLQALQSIYEIVLLNLFWSQCVTNKLLT